MVKDFVPARTALASGIVIKQHILERQKYPNPQMDWERYEYTGSIGQTPSILDGQRTYLPSNEYESNPIEDVEGGDGGSIIKTDITQSWDGTNITPIGNLQFTQEDEREFVNGEFSGSALLVEDGELNPDNKFKKPNTTPLLYNIGLGANDFGIVTPYLPPAAGSLLWNGERGTFYKNSTPILITSIDINEVDKNGVSIENALSNMSSGTLITFRAKIRFRELLPPPPQYQTLDKTFTVPISSVFAITPGVWRLEFSTPLILGYSQLPTDDYNNTSILDYDLILDPLILEGNGFANSDYNAIINNATETTPSTVYYDLDYSQGSITPVNFDAVMSGSADKALIQDYNYHARRSIIPRYSGSRLEGLYINEYSPEGTQYQDGSNPTQTWGGDQSYGKTPVVEREDTIIVDFNWGGGTYPEIANGGGLQLNKILLTGENKDDISSIGAEQAGFIGSLKNAFPIGSQPVFKQYTTLSSKTTNAKVLDYGWTVPSISNFYIASGSSTTSGNAYVLTGDKDQIVFGASTAGAGQGYASLVTTNAAGYEIPSSTIYNSFYLTEEIKYSINTLGERWFVTIYENLGEVASGTLIPYNTGYSTGLASHGVYEIISATNGGSPTQGGALNLDRNLSITQNLVFGEASVSGRNVGCLIWKAVENNQFILFENNTLSGVGKGALITSTPSDIIESEFDYITKTYGQNPINN